jgi:hypothetical protein
MEAGKLKLADGFGRGASVVSQVVVKEDESVVTAGQEGDTDENGGSDDDSDVCPSLALLTVGWGARRFVW